jgi:hypothetical protein
MPAIPINIPVITLCLYIPVKSFLIQSKYNFRSRQIINKYIPVTPVLLNSLNACRALLMWSKPTSLHFAYLNFRYKLWQNVNLIFFIAFVGQKPFHAIVPLNGNFIEIFSCFFMNLNPLIPKVLKCFLTLLHNNRVSASQAQRRQSHTNEDVDTEESTNTISLSSNSRRILNHWRLAVWLWTLIENLVTLSL